MLIECTVHKADVNIKYSTLGRCKQNIQYIRQMSKEHTIHKEDVDWPSNSHSRHYSIPSPASLAHRCRECRPIRSLQTDRHPNEVHVILPQTRIVWKQHGETMVFVGNIIFKGNSKIYQCLTSLFLLNLRARIAKVRVPATVLRPHYHQHHRRPLDCLQFPHMLDNIRQLRWKFSAVIWMHQWD